MTHSTNPQEDEELRGIARWYARNEQKFSWSRSTEGEKNEHIDFYSRQPRFKELVAIIHSRDQQIRMDTLNDVLKLAYRPHDSGYEFILALEVRERLETLTKEKSNVQ